jgi:CRISPR-associated endonuclease/helicase Cas3
VPYRTNYRLMTGIGVVTASSPFGAATAPTDIRLWAKLERDPTGRISGWHSLVDHSADVAAVVAALLDQPTINHRLATTIGRQRLDPVICIRLAALAFLHDVGKANRGFQRRIDPHASPIGHIDQLAWIFVSPRGRVHAERLMTVLGLERMAAWFADDDAMFTLWQTLFAHHGRPWSNDPVDAEAHWAPDGKGSDPIADLAAMRDALDRWFAPAFTTGPPLPDTPAFHHAFAGLLMLADWLGSDKRFFPFAHGSASDRMVEAHDAAHTALRSVGASVETRREGVAVRATDFSLLFGVPDLRPLQRHATSPTARCVVMEAETGSGKTEAALWRFRHLFEAGDVDGLYFALPTRVAATQMFQRVKRFRDALFPDEDRPAVVLAVPGQVGADDARGHPLPDFGFEWNDRPDEMSRQARWAAEHPKRFLAAQIAVGTVDQALLSAIAVRHAHLRGTALLRHLLVVDEVHASDRYMETLLSNLLHGHIQAGGHALLLSATLGAAMQARLLDTPLPPLSTARSAPYPALSWAEDGRTQILPVEPSGRVKRVQLTTAPAIDDPAEVATRALRAAERGAKVLVIRNTVRAAVETALALEDVAGAQHPALFRIGTVITLHHGRFAPTDRLRLDAAVEACLGKASADAPRVVIGTQTLEQSLDLDADLLITDLCPVDVLLQRIGRLHRHDGRTRPAGFVEPSAVVLTPLSRNLLPLLRNERGRHGLGQVYSDGRIIEATWRLVETQSAWSIPDMNRWLVEEATHPEPLAAIEAELLARDTAWGPVLDRQYAAAIGGSQQAALGLLHRDRPFGEFQINENWATRLGAKDLLAALDPAPSGPFGAPVATIRVPHFLAAGATSDDVAQVLEVGPGSFDFQLGLAKLRYDRFGLRRLGPGGATATHDITRETL